jgi:pimeloyl-ACP methyl ester carboxylesterase
MAKSNVETDGRSSRKRLLEGLPVHERRFDIGGVSTSVLEGGEGSPIVLLHGGIQAGGLVWWRAVPRLVESHRVIVPDLPGLGESEIGLGRLDADFALGWLEELIRATCRERPTLVAHSAPAAFATRFAIERTDQLRRLVLLDPGGLRRAGLPPPGLLMSALRSTVRPNERNFHRFMRRVMHDLNQVRKEDDLWSTFARYVVARGSFPGVKRTMRQAAKTGLRGSIPETELMRIEVPVALIWGRQDPLTPLGIGARISDRQGWPMRVIEDAGHLPHVEQPHAFVDALGATMGGD